MLYISLHTNASNTTRRGLVTYCMNNEYNAAYYNGYQYEKNHRLARLLNNSVSANTGLQKNSKIYVNDFFMLREHNIPAVLLEIGYHDNPLDREMLTSDNMPSLVARGILSGLLSYFE